MTGAGSGTGPPGLPRELILASAGTGKTYTLSGRIIALLSAGAPPDSLLASTFTRKAAGEILNRVLARLARASLSEVEAQVLAREARAPGVSPNPRPDPAFFQALLRSLIRELHRLNIGTLDSFFIRVGRGFSPDLGLPPGWRITDEPGARRMEAEALQAMLDESAREEMVELVRMVMRGDWGRGVHSRLLGQLQSLRELIHQAEVVDGLEFWGPEPPGAPQTSRGERERAAATLAEASLPVTRSGKPNGHFVKAVTLAREALLEGDWESFCGKGLAAKLLQGESAYYREEIPGDLEAALRLGLSLARRDLSLDLSRQARALGRLAREFDGELSRLQQLRGAYRFHDITYRLGGPDPVGNRSDVWYRLDQQARHLLLDEFQDTSLEQWEALEPLVWELLSGHLEDRSATIVADPKQSIYGWRGADPLLVRRVGRAFEFREDTLERSFRSSKWILEFVNRVFGDLPANPVWGDSEEQRRQAGTWARSFLPHRAARSLSGYVRIMAGPREENMAGEDRPEMMAWAADRIGELVEEAPRATVGVLVRKNAAVARLIMELRTRGIPASEEGATTLEDSPAVSTFLAALRLADHPGDSMAAYQVSRSPLGACFPGRDPGSPTWAREVSIRIREDLLEHGYGRTLTSWVRELGSRGSLSARDLRRLLQLTELAFRWDQRATLRPEDFVRFAASERMEAPSDARVRVMTVHQAKGLEFDQVVLPELDVPLTRGQGRYGGVVPLRNLDTGRVVRVLPRLPATLRPLIPELEEAARQEAASEIRDALGVLYVAVTRARHALHVFVAENQEPKKVPRTFGGLILGGLELEATPFHRGQILAEMGSRDWAHEKAPSPEPPPDLPGPPLPKERKPRESMPQGTVPRETVPQETVPLSRPRLAATSQRRRNLHHRTPSSLAGSETVDLATLLSLEGSQARLRGSIIHRWLQDLIWIEDWDPDPERLLRAAGEIAPKADPRDLNRYLSTLERWLSQPGIRTCLSRSAYPHGSRVATEYPFALALGAEFFTGLMDRVVFLPDNGSGAGAHVVDFKTDAMSEDDEAALAGKVVEYRPQIRLYRRAISRILNLDEEQVRASLAFLSPGRVVEL